jgi:hypothetical protein
MNESDLLYAEYQRKLQELENARVRIEAEYRQKRDELAQQCVLTHGAHQDNGGFMYGFCTRCGTFLG